MLQIIEKDNIVAISSRQIAESTGKNHNHVKRDIENALNEDVSNFGHIYFDSMNRKQTEYILPKNIALGVVSGYSFDLRMKIINRLDELEQKQNRPLSYEETIQNALLLTTERIKALENKIEQDKPLTDFGKAIANTEASISVGAFAKSIEDKLSIKFGRNTCFKWLRENGYLTNNNEPYQKWIEQKLFNVSQHLRSNSNYSTIDITTYITGKGQEYLFDKITKSIK